MSDFFMELMSEELPASILKTSSKTIHDLISNSLKKNNLLFKKSEYFFTPKRLLFIYYDLKPTTNQISVKGPNINAPNTAIEGFAKSNSVDKDQLIRKDTNKGEYFFIEKKISNTDIELILIKLLENNLIKIPWKKSMRWGTHKIKWARPLKNILCIFNNKTINFKIDNINSNNFFIDSSPLSKKISKINSLDEYFRAIKNAEIEINQNLRRNIILAEGKKIAQSKNLKVFFEENLLNEVVSLIEYPYMFLGEFNKDFLKLPSEILITSMKINQKYFPLYFSNKKLSNYFLIVSNLKPMDSGKLIIKGNQRVINARLEDASFFWENDKSKNFNNETDKLEKVIFHNKLGSLKEKLKRMDNLSQILKADLDFSNIEFDDFKRAIELCKNDLVSAVVREFPTLQGTMGYYYSNIAGIKNTISEAIKEHYKPYGPNDICPQSKVSKALAILDKMDTIAGFFSIKEEPSSSKDPFALRRAGLGIIRIIIEGKFSINLSNLIKKSLDAYSENINLLDIKNEKNRYEIYNKIQSFILERYENLIKDNDKLKIYIFKSINVDKNNLNILVINKYCELINEFVNSNEGNDFLVAYKRVLNILESNGESESTKSNENIDIKLFKTAEEKKLYHEISKIIKSGIFQKLSQISYLSSFTQPINNFFDNVQINEKNILLKNNRICLLSLLKNKLNHIVDFSKIIKGKEL